MPETSHDSNHASTIALRSRWGLLRILFILAGLLIILPILFFFGASLVVNQTGSIPAGLLEPPKELTHHRPQPSPRAPGLNPSPIATSSATSAVKTTYDDLVRAAMRAHPERARELQTYLDLATNFKDFQSTEKFLASFLKTTKNEQGGYNFAFWRPGQPQTPEQAAWLKDHAVLLDSLTRLYEEDCLPWSQVDPKHPRDASAPAYPPLSHGTWLLAAEAQRRADLGDSEGALRAIRAILHLAAWRQRDPSTFEFSDSALVDHATDELTSLVRCGMIPDAQLNALRTDLAQWHRVLYPAEAMAIAWENVYQAERAELINRLNEPWNSDVFGWDVKRHPRDFAFDLSLGRYIYIPDLPRVDRMALTALRAMDHKRAAPRYLKEYDAFNTEVLKRYHMAYPAMVGAGPVPYPGNNLIFGWKGASQLDMPDISTLYSLTFETRLNLARAALEWKLGALKAVPLAPDTDMHHDRENPWRDPFAEHPLKVATTTTATLIYSVGPDLKDQQGQVIYEMNGADVRPGDLVIHLKRY